jgi:hypothetical protein
MSLQITSSYSVNLAIIDEVRGNPAVGEANEEDEESNEDDDDSDDSNVENEDDSNEER